MRRSSGHADQQQRRQCPKGRSSCRQLASLVASRSAAKPLLAGRTLTLAQLVQVIGPCLHHAPAFWQVFSLVIDAAHARLLVPELTFDRIAAETHLIEQGRGHVYEAVPRHRVLVLFEPGGSRERGVGKESV